MSGGWLLDSIVSPSPFRTNWVFELIGTWLGQEWGVGLGTRGLGPGLETILTKLHFNMHWLVPNLEI